MDFQTTSNRLMRLARMDFSVFNEVKTDATAATTGVAIVAIATLLTGLGSWLWVLFNIDSDYRDALDLSSSDVLIKSVIIGGVLQVALWFAWGGIAYTLLTNVFRSQVVMQEMLRAMGYAFAPMAVSILFFIPVLDMPIGIFALGATAVLSNAAISACTTASAGKIAFANMAGFAVFLLVLGVLGNDSTNLAPGIFLIDIEGI